MAAVDYYLKIDGIEGESSDDKHKGEMECISFTLGASQTGSGAAGGGSGAGKVEIHDMVFHKKVDKGSPKLFLAIASHKHHKTATLHCRKGGGKHEGLDRAPHSGRRGGPAWILDQRYLHSDGTPGQVWQP